MLILQGEFRKVISFKSKSDKELYKLKIELERYDVEVFVPSKFHAEIENFKSYIGKKVSFPIYLNVEISEDKTKIYKNYVLASLPLEL